MRLGNIKYGIFAGFLVSYPIVTNCSCNDIEAGQDGITYVGSKYVVQDLGVSGIPCEVVRTISSDGLGDVVLDVPTLNGRLNVMHDDGFGRRDLKKHVHLENPRSVVVEWDLVNGGCKVIPFINRKR